MPVALRQLSEPLLNLIVLSGRVTAMDLGVLARAVQNQTYVMDRRGLLVVTDDACLRDLPLVQLAAFRRAVVEATRSQATPRGFRTAMVCRSPGNADILRMWAAFAAADADYPTEMRAFSDLDPAGRWLELSAEELARVAAVLDPAPAA